MIVAEKVAYEKSLLEKQVSEMAAKLKVVEDKLNGNAKNIIVLFSSVPNSCYSLIFINIIIMIANLMSHYRNYALGGGTQRRVML